MRKATVFLGALALLLGLVVAHQPAAAQTESNARELFVNKGGTPPPSRGPTGVPGNLWDNGNNDLVNGLASERDTAISGTGGPEGDHAATCTDDFEVPAGTYQLDDIRACIFTLAAPTGEAYIYADVGGLPDPAVANPLWGAPTTADLASAAFVDNDSRCGPAFGFLGRQYSFSPASTGVTVTLNGGNYWLAVIGDGAGNQGDRAFWATSCLTAPDPMTNAHWGSDFFAVGYWTDATTTNGPEFCAWAFDIDGTPVAPTMPLWAMLALGVALFAAALWWLQKTRET